MPAKRKGNEVRKSRSIRIEPSVVDLIKKEHKGKFQPFIDKCIDRFMRKIKRRDKK